MSEPRNAGEPSSRPVVVGLVAGCVPLVWVVVVSAIGSPVAAPFSLAIFFVVPASALLWYLVALQLEEIPLARRRLAVAAA